MDQIDFGAKTGEIICLLTGSVSSSNHGNYLIFIEITITGSTGRDPLPIELFLAFETNPFGTGAGGDNNGLCFYLIAMVVFEVEWAVAEVAVNNVSTTDVAAETLSLTSQVIHHGRSADTIRVARKIFYFSCDGQLTAGLLTLVKKRLKVGTTSIDTCGVACRTGTNN